MKYGRYCKSGMSVIDSDDNSMKCVKIDVVRTNLDSFAAPVVSPQ